MEDEQNNQSTPSRTRYKLYKILTVSLFFVVLFVVVGFVGVEATSSKSFCSTCHEMKPEAETLKASSHSEVECKECHIQSGVVNYAKAKMNGLVQVYEKATDSYPAPIHMPTQIPNSSCEKCHNMKTRNVTASGDIIIPHEKHLKDDVKCVDCHSGVAHGDIADRNVTFKTDYDKWNSTLGKQMMSDVKFTEPKMADCISCHQARNVSTACKTCHSTGMKPDSHNDPSFMKGGHGKLADKDIKKCNSCHDSMSDNPIKGLQTKTVSQQFLDNRSSADSTITAKQYAKENTFCEKCHSKKPASHNSEFFNNHGTLASKNLETCKACHEISQISSAGGNQVICSTCHPSSHSQNTGFKERHPIPLTGITKPSGTCYKCHDKATCTKCHKEE
ncbi:NapC/NirT family cytochrome c [Bacillus sp. EB600]|uniref:cytochrome c3 family protein n=1 Tax=Bacillus sp. EB600 TaxID=2806345 RepID=UPI00210BA9F1|nr:NapC/NirT family cytochrome c [Bacillus sp. EB600]MCQ6278717.1 NapC/NirT family cytochrome c [Bacillus sp. EB600]